MNQTIMRWLSILFVLFAFSGAQAEKSFKEKVELCGEKYFTFTPWESKDSAFTNEGKAKYSDPSKLSQAQLQEVAQAALFDVPKTLKGIQCYANATKLPSVITKITILLIVVLLALGMHKVLQSGNGSGILELVLRAFAAAALVGMLTPTNMKGSFNESVWNMWQSAYTMGNQLFLVATAQSVPKIASGVIKVVDTITLTKQLTNVGKLGQSIFKDAKMGKEAAKKISNLKDKLKQTDKDINEAVAKLKATPGDKQLEQKLDQLKLKREAMVNEQASLTGNLKQSRKNVTATLSNATVNFTTTGLMVASSIIVPIFTVYSGMNLFICVTMFGFILFLPLLGIAPMFKNSARHLIDTFKFYLMILFNTILTPVMFTVILKIGFENQMERGEALSDIAKSSFDDIYVSQLQKLKDEISKWSWQDWLNFDVMERLFAVLANLGETITAMLGALIAFIAAPIIMICLGVWLMIELTKRLPELMDRLMRAMSHT